MPTTIYDSLGHLDSECLDLYCAGRLDPRQHHNVRAHLAECAECREYERQELAFRELLFAHEDRLATVPIRGQARPQTSPVPRWIPLTLAASLLLALLAFASARSMSTALPAPRADITLYAMRGVPSPLVAASAHLRLRLDEAGLPDAVLAQALAAEIVDAGGHRVAAGSPRREAGFAVLDVEQKLPTGRYWVRLRLGSTELREFELVIR